MEKIRTIIASCNGNMDKILKEMLALQFSAAQLQQVDSDRIDDLRCFVLENISSFSARDLYVIVYQGLFSETDLFYHGAKGLSPLKRTEYKAIKSTEWVPSMEQPDPPMVKPGPAPSSEPKPNSGPEPSPDPEPNPNSEPNTTFDPMSNPNQEDSDWNDLDKSDPIQLTEYVRKYPQGKHYEEARTYLSYCPITLEDLLDAIRTQPPSQVSQTMKNFFDYDWVTKQQFLSVLAKDHNLFGVSMAYQLLIDEVLTRYDFFDAGFDNDVIDAIFQGVDSDDYFDPFNATELTRESTEFYFWGISGSGKSCALGAIMSAANSGEVAKAMIVDKNCDAASYLEYLRSVFTKGQLGKLPAGNPVGNFAAMGFSLIEKGKPGNWIQRKIRGISKAGKEHPITCIDMAGGMLQLMSRRIDELSKAEQDYIDNLNHLLCKSAQGNHAQHFFLVEYKDDDLNIQFDQLNRAIDQIQRLGLFKKKTDHIWIMVTKCDRFNAESEHDLVQKVSQYIVEKCSPLYNKLSQICEAHSIDKGKPRVLPFWVGNVELQQYCKFDPIRANKMVEIMLDTPFASNIK